MHAAGARREDRIRPQLTRVLEKQAGGRGSLPVSSTGNNRITTKQILWPDSGCSGAGRNMHMVMYAWLCIYPRELRTSLVDGCLYKERLVSHKTY